MIAALDAAPLSLTTGGLRRYVAELSVALARGFPEDRFVLTSNQEFGLPDGAPENLRALPVPGAGRWWLNGVRKAIRQSGAQVFHGTNFEVPWMGKTPAVLTIHDLSPWRDRAWHHAAERVRSRTPWLVRLGRARIILTVSEAVRKEVISHFGVESGKVRAVPMAASDLFRPMPVTNTARYFLCVATLEPRKNIPALVRAWRETRAQTGAELWLAGRAREDFVPLAPESGLKLLGEVRDQDLPALFSNAIGFVYPTLYEGFGLPVLEAMQCGCPVITSRDPAVTEVSGEAAMHVETNEDMGRALQALAAQPELRARLREASLKRASAFSWQSTARATRAIYAELAGL